ncbi:MAG: hypothetical protein SVV80_04365 [Planctomycetota bacterium]|nr:hypothetical protein [Planctomycetota bacterium]
MKTLVSIAVLHIAAMCALAADQPEVTTVSRAFAPYVKSGYWGQVTASLHNPTNETVPVRFVYFAEDPSRGRIRYTQTVNLPGRTYRNIWLGQRIGKMKKKRSQAEKIVHQEQAFRLENARTNEILDSDFILVSPLSPTQRCLAYVDPEDQPGQDHSYLSKIPGELLGEVALVISRQKQLPDRWYGYSLLKMFIISSANPAELSDSQIGALLDWVGHGGVLLVTAHSVADRTLTGRMAEAAGVVVSGTHQEYRLEASGTGDGDKFQTDLKTPITMAHLCPTDAKVLWQANGMPLLTLRRHGAGVVFTLAVPIGALTTKQTGPLWQTISGRMGRVQPVLPDAFAASAESEFARIAGRESRDRRTPACIIGIQAGLFLLLGVFLWLRRRGELGWVVMIPLGMLCGVGLLIWGMTFRDEPRVSFLAMVSARSDGRGHVQQLSTYYTPEKDQIDFSSGSPLGTIRPMASTSASLMESVEIAGKRTMVLEGVQIMGNSSRSAYAEAPVDLPGRMVAEVRLGPKGLEGTITNNTGEDIFDAVLVTGGASYAVGRLPAGSTTAVVVNDPPLPKDSYTGMNVRSKTDRLRNDLISALVSPPSGSQRYLSAPTPMMLGWFRRPLLNPLGESRRQQAEPNGLTLLTCPMPLLKSPSGTKVVVPGGLLKLHIGGRPPVWVPKENRFNTSTLPGEVELDFVPPEGTGEIIDARAVMRLAMRAPNCRISIFGFVGPEGQVPEKTLIKTVDRPVGAYKITVDSLMPVEGRYKITIKIGPVETSKTGAQERISTFWKIESLNLTLEGMSK